jgi:hypothetical protein
VTTRQNLRPGLLGLLRRIPRPRRSMMRCELCELTGGPFPAREAAALLQVHRQLQHGRFASSGPALPPVSVD